jgi:3-phenylpropionate/trans-cinnamate dioxygenase ferredoxin component
MTLLRAAAAADVAEGATLRVEVAGKPVCLARSGGEVFAIGDTCSHADVSLAEGDVEDGAVECWLHGSKFDLRTGAPTGLPATRPVPVYPVTVDGERVLVDIDAPKEK